MRFRAAAVVGAAWVATIVVGRGLVALPEQCGPVTAAEVRAAAAAAVDWFAANQLDDGRFTYRFDATTGRADRRPHLVRHAGVTMALYQADAAGVDGARPVADRAAEWALDRLVDAGGGGALEFDGVVPTGASALLAAGLAVRRAATGDDVYDEQLTDLGRFLVAMVEPSGAVLANWDLATGAPVPERYSVFYTGEAFWALTMLATVDPDGGWAEPAARIARYVATDRAEAEPRFPPLSDHWSAYGLAQLALGAGVPLGEAERDYAERLSHIFGLQVRYESQRTDEGWNAAFLRGDQVLGAGLGTLGEGLGSLYRLARGGDGASGAADRDALAERTVCVASLLVDRQIGSADELGRAHGAAAIGAWFAGGVTQKDDQQHALSALLLAAAPLADGFLTRTSSDDPSPVRLVWLVVVAVAATNPIRVRRAVASAGPGARVAGAAATAAVTTLGALVAGPVVRAMDVSASTMLVAVGLVVVVGAVVDLARPAPALLPPGRAPALVPVAFPALLRPAPVLVPFAIGAAAGAAAGVLVAAAAGGVVAVALAPAGSGRDAVEAALARLVAAVAVVGGIDLLAHGVLAI